ncbi:hypothetical protein [Bdellovibrio svalbardensis]|uniref:FecR protein domain-containing protein n=1 Tax=Bdellovibrio svalbardensis TaxID=2972972 RepID=A0ABT6DK08_9BACT|nr:hypothetical protein [Bdellovibrio svalbardensis]MDG0815433.1 hypothetical protein [Bdellovibrio svalbardensis]
MKLKRFDLFLLVLFLLTSLVAGYFSARQLSPSIKGTRKKIGTTLSTQEKVYRKTADDFFYFPLEQGSGLYLNDQVTTGLNSGALLGLGEKTQVQLDPLSHIVLHLQEDGYGIQIREGILSASIARGESVIIDGNRSTTSLSPTSKIRYSKSSKGTEIELLEGEAQVQGPGENTPLKKGESTRFSVKGAPTPKLTLIQPLPEATQPQTTPLVEVSWEPIPETEKYEIQIFQDSSLIYSDFATQEKSAVKLTDFGKYKVQVSAWKNLQMTAVSEKRSFKIQRLPQFKMLTPTEGKLTLESTQEKLPVNFSWEGADPTHLEIVIEAMTPGPTDNPPQTVSQVLAQNIQSITFDLPSGHFRWHLLHSVGETPWIEFEIAKQLSPLLPPPKISRVSKELSPQEKKEGLKVGWPQVPEASSYEVEWQGTTLKTNTALWPSAIKSTVNSTYRVRTINKDNLPGEWSPPALLKITEKAPPAIVKIPASKPVEPIAAKEIPQPSPLAMKIEPSPTPAAPESEETEDGFNKNIPKPKVLSPLPASNFIAQRGAIILDIRLSNEHCENYEVEIDSSNKFSNPIVLTSPAPNLQKQIKRGRFYLRARCWKEGDMGAWSRPTQVSVQ